MVRGLLKVLFRLMLAFVLGVGFFALAQIPVGRYLPADGVLKQSFGFELVETYADVTDWQAFAGRQKKVLAKLAEEELGAQERRYAVGVEEQRGTITLRVQCQGPVPAAWTDGFERVVARYVAYRGQLERRLGPEDLDGAPDDWLSAEELEGLAACRERYAAAQRELTELEIERCHLAVTCADLRDQLARGPSQTPRGEFASLLEGRLNERMIADRELKSLLGEARTLSQQLVDVDRRIAGAQQAQQRDRLVRRRQETQRRYELIRRTFEVHRDLLTLKLAEELWGEFERQVRDQLDRAGKAIKENLERQGALREGRDGALERLSGLSTVQMIGEAGDSLVDTRLVGRLLGPIGFARLQAPSLMQQLILGALAMTGFFAGLLLPGVLGGASGGRPSRWAAGPPQGPLAGTSASQANANEPLAAIPIMVQARAMGVGDGPEETPWACCESASCGATDKSDVRGASAEAALEERGAEREGGVAAVVEEASEAGAAGRAQQSTEPPEHEYWAGMIDQLAGQAGSVAVVLAAVGGEELSVRFTINLATELVRRKGPVLLIEVEQKERPLAAVFELSSEPGRLRGRRGRCGPGTVIHQTILPGLAFMGVVGKSGSEKPGSGGLGESRFSWDDLRKEFRVLLFYAPHALAGGDRSKGRGEWDWLLDGGDVLLGVARTGSQDAVDLQGVRAALAARRVRWLGLALSS